jgi:hypothetical protein
MARRKPELKDLIIADYAPQDIRSIQAFALYAMSADKPPAPGEPAPEFSPYDAKRVLDWLHKASMTYENSTLISLLAANADPDLAPFIDGKRSVGQQLNKLMVLKPSAFEPGSPRNEEGVGPEPRAISEAREF